MLYEILDIVAKLARGMLIFVHVPNAVLTGYDYLSHFDKSLVLK